MKYKIEWAYSLMNLVELVNLDLKEGWKLQGGVDCTSKNEVTQYIQALVKE